jgi:DNA primase
MDPCELRMASGDAAVRDLVAARIPLVEFVLRSTVARYDLDTAEGRSAALDRGIPMVAQIKDHGLRDEYATRLAGLVGMPDPNRIVARVRGLLRADGRRGSAQQPEPAQKSARSEPAVDEAIAGLEREVLKVAVQLPALAGPEFDTLTNDAFLIDAHRQVRAAIAEAGGTAAAVTGPAWTEQIAAHVTDERVRTGVHALAVEPLHTGLQSADRYARGMLARMHEVVANRTIVALKSKLQRINPVEEPDRYARLFGELVSYEAYRRNALERAIDGL